MMTMDFATQHQIVAEVAAALRRHQEPVTPSTVERTAMMAANLADPAPSPMAQQVQAELSKPANKNAIAVVYHDTGEVRTYLRPKERTAPADPPLTLQQKFEQSRPFGSPSKGK
jgi:hypothetical protein